MKRKERREIINNSLLENPNMETQAKEMPYKVVFRVTFIVLLFSLLFISYVFNFSNIYPKLFGKYFTSNFDSSNFYQTKSCDLVVITPYLNLEEAEINDVVVYSTNIGDGSGMLVAVFKEEFELKLESGEVVGIKKSLIVGKQEKNISGVGCFWALIDSYYGVVALSCLLLAYAAYLTFSRINYENTEHGKKLYKRFRYKQKEEKARNKLLARVRNIEGIDLIIAQMLEGSFAENKKQFLAFDYETKGKLKAKYKYVLSEIHEAYLAKKDLSREERRQISGIIELMFVASEFDLDMEYMLIDLILKTKLVEFEIDSFKESALVFIRDCKHKSDLFNFSSVLYVLVYKNSRLRTQDVKDIALAIRERLPELSNMEEDKQNSVPEAILGLIKI